jgi:hypothetical protein
MANDNGWRAVTLGKWLLSEPTPLLTNNAYGR